MTIHILDFPHVIKVTRMVYSQLPVITIHNLSFPHVIKVTRVL